MKRRRWDITARPANLRLARLGHQVEVLQLPDEIDERLPGPWTWTCSSCRCDAFTYEGPRARRDALRDALRHVGLSAPIPPLTRAGAAGRRRSDA